ncbi:MAG TPA: LysM peptidoglycan-binding domain-containing protein [Chloroflexota bacterium]|nr:LysM peptidoglycan-binding domain-containing protein [Chloroflexota bacterium]
MKASKTLRAARQAGGPERFLLGAALLVPLGVVLLALMQLPSTSLASSWNLTAPDSSVNIAGQRPVSSNLAPPPTLAAPTATPKPTATPLALAIAAAPTATPQKGGTYVVQPGDELKHIAADYNVSIWKLIEANHISNPDSLKIGQELRIPSD